jgi:hypothetical protein
MMPKQVSINILKNTLLPGSLVGAYLSIYFNLFIYWVWSLLYDLKEFYVIPFIVIAIITISILIYLSKKNYNRKLLYIISISFLPFITVSLFSIIMPLFLSENLRSNIDSNIGISFIYISGLIIHIPYFLASYNIFSFLKGYCNPKLNHLITVSILITICPLVYPLFIPFFMIADGFATIKPYSVSLYFLIAGFIYSLPFALYYFIKNLYKK